MDFPRMHVGMAAIFQNPFDQISDRQVYQNELRLADQAEPLGFESEQINVYLNKDGLVEIEAAFDREEFCAVAGNWPEQVVVFGWFTNGKTFFGTADVKIIRPGLKEIAELSYYWLQTGCKKPHWCGGLDINQDTVVNLTDFALLQNQTIEIITK